MNEGSILLILHFSRAPQSALKATPTSRLPSPLRPLFSRVPVPCPPQPVYHVHVKKNFIKSS